MPYSYSEHVSDIGIRAVGATLEEAFASGIEAALAVMFDTKGIEARPMAEVTASAPEVDLLFVEAINEVLSIVDRDRLAAAGVTGARIKGSNNGGYLTFTAVIMGEPFDPDTHDVHTEVKAATYSGLRYAEEAGAHVLECVLDV